VVETHHIERAQEIDPSWLRNHRPQYIGVTAGASTPEEAIEEVMSLLKDAVR
jgi:4-hydroxy-3-methylbut-2-enyl diphosphate reductase IspH